MKRAWLRSAFLATAVAALGLFVYLKPASDVRSTHALSALKPEAARVIRVQRSGAQPMVLEKRGEEWFLTAPLSARADPLRVQRLLAIAGAKSVLRLAATDLQRFELERPAARLTVDDQAFDFGIVNEMSREQYVLTGGAVYAVNPAYGAALPARPGELVDKQLLGRNELPARIELPGFTVAREAEKWVLSPRGDDLSQDDLQRWVDNWRYASALHVEPYRKGAPVAEVRMQFRSGAALDLGILSRAPEVALLRPDEKLVYYLSSGAARRLLSPPGAAADDTAAKR